VFAIFLRWCERIVASAQAVRESRGLDGIYNYKPGYIFIGRIFFKECQIIGPTIVRLLMICWASGAYWRVMQVLTRLRFLGGLQFEQHDWSRNPLYVDHCAASGSEAQGSGVVEQVCQGEGVSGALRSSGPFAFAGSFCGAKRPRRFRGEGKQTVKGKHKGKGINVARCPGKHLLRRQMASNHWLSRCRGVCISADATRLGGKDRLMVAICGPDAACGLTEALWAPPQALLRSLGPLVFRTRRLIVSAVSRPPISFSLRKVFC